MLKESRVCKNQYGIESVITDCYSNARNEFEASKIVLGRDITRDDFECELKSGRLIVEEAVDYKWYVSFSNNAPLWNPDKKNIMI